MAKKGKIESKDYFGFMGDAYKTWSENMFKTDFFGEGGMEKAKQLNDVYAKGIKTYIKACDNAMSGTLEITKKGFEAGRKSMAGEEIDMDMFEELKSAYKKSLDCMEDVLKETPFEGIKDIDDAVRKSLDSFSDEQKSIKAALKEMASFNTKMANLSVTAVKETMNSLSDAKEKGTISLDGYKKIIGEYGKALKKALKNADCPVAGLPEYSDKIDDAISLANKNLDVFLAWAEISLKSTRALNKSAEEICKTGESAFLLKDCDAGGFYKAWTGAFESAARDFIDNAKYNESIPNFLTNCSDYMKLAGEQYKKAMTPPAFVTEGEFTKITKELDELKSAAGKNAK